MKAGDLSASCLAHEKPCEILSNASNSYGFLYVFFTSEALSGGSTPCLLDPILVPLGMDRYWSKDEKAEALEEKPLAKPLDGAEAVEKPKAPDAAQT